MDQWITLETPHGAVSAWQALPSTPAEAGLVVIQEIFGANAHIRAVAERYAMEGYAVLAPALFDPLQPGVELDYDAAGFARGRALVDQLGLESALAIVDTAAAALRAYLAGIGAPPRVGVVGYCWGGTVALLAALELGLPAVSYYGARNLPLLDDPHRVSAPKAPVMFHFGEHDPSIPPDAVQAHRRALPSMQVCTYPAGHAFNRDVDPSAFHPESAALALRRSLGFFADHLR